MQRRVFYGLWMISLVLILMGIPSVLFFPTVSLGSAFPNHITSAFDDDPSTTQAITWQMDFDAGNGQLQYVEENMRKPFPYDVRTVTANVEKISTNIENLTRHTVTLRKLKPGMRYHYRVGYGNVWSKWCVFTTAAERK